MRGKEKKCLCAFTCYCLVQYQLNHPLFFLRQYWFLKKPTDKVPMTFISENKNCKRAWKFPQQILRTMVCVDYFFLTLNLQCTFVFLSNSNWFVKLHRDRYPFPFFSFSVAGCWDCVHGSPRSTTHRSTHQGWNRKRKVALSPWFSQPNAALIVYKKEKIAGSAKVMLKKCQNPAGVLLVNHHQPIVYEVTANLSLIWKGS